MKKLIDAQTAYDVLTDYYHHSTDIQHEALREALSRVPTVDAVPVVRCKDCTHYNAGYECLNEGYGVERDPEWFCADGERKDGDGNG